MHGIISHRLDANIGNTCFNVIFLHDLIRSTKICQRIAVSSKNKPHENIIYIRETHEIFRTQNLSDSSPSLFRRPDRRGRGLHLEKARRATAIPIRQTVCNPSVPAWSTSAHTTSNLPLRLLLRHLSRLPSNPTNRSRNKTNKSKSAIKKIEEQNRQNKLENCKIAKINRQVAESARLANRDSLIKQYQNDVINTAIKLSNNNIKKAV